MRNKRFICRNCNKRFSVAKIYEEKHGLDSPPYERIQICPRCESDNYFEFDFYVEKIQIAECILPLIVKLNRYINAIKDVFGSSIKNDDLFSCALCMTELIVELFDYMPTQIERELLRVDTDKKAECILMYLRGEL